MSRSLDLYLDDILASIAKIQRYTTDMTWDTFTADELTFDAVARNLQIISEAVKNIPPEVRSQYPQIEWRKIAGLQDIIAHTYFAIEDQVIWDIVQTKLDDLRACVTTMKSDSRVFG